VPTFVRRGHRHKNKNICDDREEADTEAEYDKYFICEELRKDGELWYRYTSFGIWAHAVYSGWGFPDGYFVTCV
jgi:hypothetical protein